MLNRPIRFHHRGAVVEVHDVAPTRTVLDWLREDAHCTGTKEGCNEGDCGACTVVVGEAIEVDDLEGSDAQPRSVATGALRGLRLRPVNACIQFLPMLDGKALFTVEDLKTIAAEGRENASTDSLHPVQRALVECHGSQCGFCTPGFVMSLWSTYEHHVDAGTRPSRQQLADDLSGNLCRCTGYRPIIDAGQRMFDLPKALLDTASVLSSLARVESMTSAATPATTTPDRLSYRLGGHVFDAPRTLDEFAELRLARPDARVLGGSTDIGLWVNKMLRVLPDLLYIGKVDALKRIELREGPAADRGAVLSIGAAASIEDAFRALVARRPALEDLWLRFGSPPIRHAGTIGGNVANGSPIGDFPPLLMALDATLVLRRGGDIRRLKIADFYVDYMQNRLERGEFLQAIEVPLDARTSVRVYKISKRFDSDISALCAGLAIELEGEIVKTARFAFGGMAATVKRAAAAEAAVVGEGWSEATLEAAAQALGHDYTPLGDMRASADYRLQVSKNLLRRFWLETRVANPLPPAALSVWSVMPHVAAPSLA